MVQHRSFAPRLAGAVFLALPVFVASFSLTSIFIGV